MSNQTVLPPYGLSGGRMVFDPSTLVLFIQSHQRAISFLCDGDRTDDTATRQFFRLNHERDHLKRHLSTTYGTLYFVLHSLLVRYFASAANCQPDSSFPLLGLHMEEYLQGLRERPFLSRHREEILALLHDEFECSRVRYVMVRELVRVLDGAEPSQDASLSQQAALLVHDLAREVSLGPVGADVRFDFNAPPRPELYEFYRSDSPYYPFVAGEPFGARSLLEFFGGMREFTHAASNDRVLDEWTDLASEEEYLRVIGLFNARYLPKEYKHIPIELEAAADLALWIPFTPTGFRVEGSAISWHDVQPGWRFLRLCEHFHKQGKWTAMFRDSKDMRGHDEVFKECQDAACEALGWPKVGDLALEWADYIETEQARPSLSHLLLDLDGSSGRLQLSRDILRERPTQPYTLYFQALSNRELDRALMFPGFVCADGDVVNDSKIWEGSSGVPIHWWEMSLVTGTRFFAEGFAEHPHFKRHHAERSIGMLSVLMKGLKYETDRIRVQMEKYVSGDGLLRFWSET